MEFAAALHRCRKVYRMRGSEINFKQTDVGNVTSQRDRAASTPLLLEDRNRRVHVNAEGAAGWTSGALRMGWGFKSVCASVCENTKCDPRPLSLDA